MNALLGFFYDSAIRVYGLAIALVAVFSPKARAFRAGRRAQNQRETAIRQGRATASGPVIWMHCASLGEFEQGRPVLESMRDQWPDSHLILSFFSPSGYQKRKDYPVADQVLYLPLDTPGRARRFVSLLEPDLAIFVKYEFWYRHLRALAQSQTPTLLISAIFRPGQLFFHPWLGHFHRRMLTAFSHIFVQDESSASLLKEHGYDRVSVAGDTRVDRVLTLAGNPTPIPALRDFAGDDPVFIAGSTWPRDEALLLPLFQQTRSTIKWIIAPHELSENHLRDLQAQLGPSARRFTQLQGTVPEGTRIILLDTIGHLGSAYQYAHYAYIGGGFGKGIHNTLEPAAFGLPLLFGPRYHKFQEALELVKTGGAISVSNEQELMTAWHALQTPERDRLAREAVSYYLQRQRGATRTIIKYLREQLPAR